ncbi:UbiA family prenyltransferase [Haloferula chungangensis]|uniref:UbiA family prenyltransferase n=1 Tax=Haloferula chungangensis TaxID=1048331 RepID=A0ABW2LBB5_9BACT
MTHLRALLASLRIANAPSVVSNVWIGYMLGWFYWGENADPFSDLSKLIFIGLSLYFAGNLANDWFDQKWDRQHRPERALPAGLFSPFVYLVGALFLAINGILSASSISYPVFYAALAILASIILYTWLHKRTRWAVIPMGLCRAGLYAMGFAASKPQFHDYGFQGPVSWLAYGFIFTHALGLLIYIAGLSLAARYESTEHPPHGMVLLSRAMLFLPLAAMSSWWMIYYPLASIIGLIPFAIWLSLCLTKFRKPVPRFVSALLAGIPLIDFIAAVPLANSLGASDLSLQQQPLLLATLVVPLVAFALGRLLQRVAPAT